MHAQGKQAMTNARLRRGRHLINVSLLTGEMDPGLEMRLV